MRFPVTQPGPNAPDPGVGGCGAESPVTIAITVRFSSVGTMSPPLDSPPSRQWSVFAELERNFVQPSR